MNNNSLYMNKEYLLSIKYLTSKFIKFQRLKIQFRSMTFKII